MSNVFLIIESEKHEPDRIHGIFTSLKKAVAAGPKIKPGQPDNTLTISERPLDKVYNLVHTASNSVIEGEVAVYKMDGTIIQDNRPSYKTMVNPADILNKHIYADPVRVVVEQLAIHAQNAHAKAGNSDKPFRVLLPTTSSPGFHIRDYGLGYSVEEMVRVFSSHSVAADSLDGRGDMEAKSALAYTPIFNVVSFNGNTAHRCEVSIDADSFKAVAKKVEQVAVRGDTEGTGVDIVFPVEPKDYERFRQAALEILPKFNVEVYDFTTKLDLRRGDAPTPSL